MKEFIAKKPMTLTPGVEEVVNCLKSRDCAVNLVSGGFTLLIEPLASKLGIPKENIYANQLRFNETGKLLPCIITLKTCIIILIIIIVPYPGMVGAVGKISALQPQGPQFDPWHYQDLD